MQGRSVTLLTAAFLLVATPILTHAAPTTSDSTFLLDTGNKLVAACEHVALLGSGNDDVEGTALGISCAGYIRGSWEMLRLMDTGMQQNGRLGYYCPYSEDGMTVLQVTKMVLKYADQHPEELHEAPAFLVLGALQTAFPCGGK